MRPREILEQLNAGTLDGLEKPCGMKERTLFDRIRKLKAERGDPRFTIPLDRIDEAIDATLVAGLELVRGQIAALQTIAAERPLSTKEGTALRTHLKTLEQLQTKRANKRSANPAKRASTVAGPKPAPLLEQLAADWAQRETASPNPTPIRAHANPRAPTREESADARVLHAPVTTAEGNGRQSRQDVERDVRQDVERVGRVDDPAHARTRDELESDADQIQNQTQGFANRA